MKGGKSAIFFEKKTGIRGIKKTMCICFLKKKEEENK